jgi:hypothetical protein
MASSIASSLASILSSERREKRKQFRRIFVFRDENSVNPTVVTLTNNSVGLTGPVLLLYNKYKQFNNYSSGLAIVQQTRPTAPGQQETEKSFECVAILDLDSFLAAFSESLAFADALCGKILDVCNEWQAENSAPNTVGVRVPVERSYRLAQHVWKGRRRQEASQYDLQLSECSLTAEVAATAANSTCVCSPRQLGLEPEAATR